MQFYCNVANFLHKILLYNLTVWIFKQESRLKDIAICLKKKFFKKQLALFCKRLDCLFKNSHGKVVENHFMKKISHIKLKSNHLKKNSVEAI